MKLNEKRNIQYYFMKNKAKQESANISQQKHVSQLTMQYALLQVLSDFFTIVMNFFYLYSI